LTPHKKQNKWQKAVFNDKIFKLDFGKVKEFTPEKVKMLGGFRFRLEDCLEKGILG